jgi:hypothetical protein
MLVKSHHAIDIHRFDRCKIDQSKEVQIKIVLPDSAKNYTHLLLHFVPVVKLFGDLDGNVRVIVCFAFFIRYDVVYVWRSFISISRSVFFFCESDPFDPTYMDIQWVPSLLPYT